LTPQQVEDDRKHLLARVGSTIGGDNSYVMLGCCMPQPFPMDAWRACRDDACLGAILKQAMDSIHECRREKQSCNLGRHDPGYPAVSP
jgi:hypothetical protein